MINSTLCYLEKDGAYLMLHRIKKKKDVNKDKWIGVGGKFEDKESPEDCLKREVFEETGLTLTRWCFRGIVTFASDEAPTEYMHLFTADRFEGEMIRGDACSEGTLEWVPVEKIPSLNLWAGDKIFLRLLSENAPFFSLKLCYQGSTLVGVELNGHIVPPQNWGI